MEEKRYEAIVIGGGPAGLTCGLYLGRFRISALLLEDPGQASQVVYPRLVENYPGFPRGIAGSEFISRLRRQAGEAGVEIVSGRVERLFPRKDFFEVAASGTTYSSRLVVMATGAEPAELGVEGEKRLKGKGVSYCATCDGPLFKEKEVAVVGGGDQAVEEALFLSGFSRKVYLVHRREKLRAAPILVERLKKNSRIDFIPATEVTAILGEDAVAGVELTKAQNRKKEKLVCQGVFIFVGMSPASELVKGFLELDKEGYILTSEKMETSRPGIFACGDVRKRYLRQIVTAAGEGAIAAHSCREYLEGGAGRKDKQ